MDRYRCLRLLVIFYLTELVTSLVWQSVAFDSVAPGQFSVIQPNEKQPLSATLGNRYEPRHRDQADSKLPSPAPWVALPVWKPRQTRPRFGCSGRIAGSINARQRQQVIPIVYRYLHQNAIFQVSIARYLKAYQNIRLKYNKLNLILHSYSRPIR